jgi:hypothetical protein
VNDDKRACCDQIVRGYFALGDWESVVRIKCDADFRIHIWARNVETFDGGVQVLTPPSQFRTAGSTGPNDGLVLDVAAQTGVDLGGLGGQAGETIELSSAGGARVSIFVTIVTCDGATVDVATEPGSVG